MSTAPYRRWALLPGLMLLATLLYASPLLEHLFQGGTWMRLGGGGWQAAGWGTAFVRSASFATLAVWLSVALAFAGSVALARADARLGRWMMLLLIVPLAGSVVVGFVAKLQLRHELLGAWVAEREFWSTWILMLVVECWQYCPLFLVMFWLHLQTVPPPLESFARASRLNLEEQIRDVYWPHARNLALLLALFGFTETFRSFVKFEIILRGSPGTGTELVGTWLQRSYATFAKVDPVAAVSGTLSYCALVMVLSAGLSMVVVQGVRLTLPLLAWLLAPAHRFRPHLSASTAERAGAALALATLLPFLTLLPLAARPPDLPWRSIFVALVMAFAALSIVILCSVSFAIVSRVILLDRLERFDRRSIPVFLALFLLRFIPPLGLVLSGYRWASQIGSMGLLPAAVVWTAAQVILAFPLLTAFVQYNHFSVSTAELRFQQISGSSFGEVARESFHTRFRAQYALVALFGFSLILNEDSVNTIMAYQVPSIAHELTLRLAGRAGTYGAAAQMCMILLLPVFLAIWSWSRYAGDAARVREG